MFLRLTDEHNNLIVINADKIDAVCLENNKNKIETRVCMVSGCYFTVKETVSEISLLLQSAGKVLKYGESEK